MRDVELQFNRPGTPTENAKVERFNYSYRIKLPDVCTFNSLSEIKIITKEWTIDYNTERYHKSLDKLTPIEFLERYNQPVRKVSHQLSGNSESYRTKMIRAEDTSKFWSCGV